MHYVLLDGGFGSCRTIAVFNIIKLAWVNGKSGRQNWRYHADAFQRSIISEAIYHLIDSVLILYAIDHLCLSEVVCSLIIIWSSLCHIMLCSMTAWTWSSMGR